MIVPNPPATSEEIRAAEKALGVELPADYVRFMEDANGGAGAIGETEYVDIWPVTDLRERNDGYQVSELAPGLVLFGSDGGGSAYAFDRHAGMRIIEVPFIGMSRHEARVIASSFAELMVILGSR